MEKATSACVNSRPLIEQQRNREVKKLRLNLPGLPLIFCCYPLSLCLHSHPVNLTHSLIVHTPETHISRDYFLSPEVL